jgi:2-polyprenyl-3-methyl-5-hydroxy-6-metoxy-1,4-benzoquinol methylase
MHSSISSSRCPYCGGDAPERLKAPDINRRISHNLFHYHECGSCRLLFLRDVPANLGDYYPDEYYYLPKDIEELARCAAPEMYKVDLVQRFMPGGRLIEIGPGSCGFAYLAKQAGFDVTAIEMHDRSCAFLRDVVGVSVVESADELVSLRSVDPADVIVLWQVIEHLAAPWDLISVASSRLKPGGILVVAAPNPDSLQRRLLGSRWVHLDAPRHVRLPSAKFVEQIANAEGLETVLVTTRDHGSIGWDRFGWQFLFGNLFRNRYLRRGAQLAGTIFSWLMAPLEAREGVGTAYTIILRKASL